MKLSCYRIKNGLKLDQKMHSRNEKGFSYAENYFNEKNQSYPFYEISKHLIHSFIYDKFIRDS